MLCVSFFLNLVFIEAFDLSLSIFALYVDRFWTFGELRETFSNNRGPLQGEIEAEARRGEKEARVPRRQGKNKTSTTSTCTK